MNKFAILHEPLSQYAYAVDSHSIKVRLRTQKNDVAECFVCYGDRVDPDKQIHIKTNKMYIAASDGLYDYYEAVIADEYTRICYFFKISDEKETCYYTQRGLLQEADNNRTEYFQFPYIRREDMYHIPDWAEDIVMYHIFPDSFANGKRQLNYAPAKCVENGITYVTSQGGTLQGIIDNLDYIGSLGINCLYLNPVFRACSYHKYDTVDYMDIDPCFGTKDDLKKLIKLCHKQGIRVILDGVFNHCGSEFPGFKDVLTKGEASEYRDWFYDMSFPVKYEDPPGYEAFAYVKEMPKLNTGNPDVADYLCKVGTYWIEEADIDGWRLDVANEINHDFWRRFRASVRGVKPDCLLIGEIWEDSQCWLMGDQFDSTMNYMFTDICNDFFAARKIDADEFDCEIQKMIMRYPDMVSRVQMNFLDSHDIPRFLWNCKGDTRRFRLALMYLIMGPGIPSVFYGDERYISGSTEPEYRAAMPWNREGCEEYLKKLISIRHCYSAVRHGAYRRVYAKGGLYIFEKKLEDECILVAVNNSDTSVKADIEPGYTLIMGNNADNMIEAEAGQIYVKK